MKSDLNWMQPMRNRLRRCLRCLVPRVLCAMGLALIASAAWGTTVMVMSIGRNNAQILINGSLVRTLFLGEVSPEGIALRLIDSSAVVMEVDGRRLRLAIGQSTMAEVVLRADNLGHFRVSAMLNGVAVPAVIDTGASLIAISHRLAMRLGIDYRRGQRSMSQTASGVVPTYLVTLARVEIGSIVLGNVACAVLEVDAPVLDEVLIGNSFLNQVQMQRNGSTMVLTRSNVF